MDYLKSKTCFLCLNSEGDPKKEVSLKSILRYLQISSQQQTGNGLKYSSSSPKVPKKSFLDFYLNLSGSNVSVALCEGKCANVRNRLVELIQLWEVVEMKISHWLEELEELILKGDDNPNGHKKDEHMDLKSLRVAILEKCRDHKHKVAKPEVNVKRMTKKETETVVSQQRTSSKAGNNLPKSRFLNKTSKTFQRKSSLPNPEQSPNKIASISATAEADDAITEPVERVDFFDGDSVPNSPASPLDEPEKSLENVGISHLDYDDPNWLPSPPPLSQSSQPLKSKPKQRKTPQPKQKKAKLERKNIAVRPGDVDGKSSEEATSFQCSQCGKLFQKMAYLRKHTRRHLGLKAICEKCGRTISPKYMQDHSRYHCPGSFSSTDPAHAQIRFPCSGCGKTFSGNGSLWTHVQKCVKKVRHECPNCTKTFNSQGALYKHRLLANCKPPEESETRNEFICTVCGKGFGTSHSRRHHYNYSHRNPGRFVCTHCGRKFSRKPHLRRHLNSFHVDPGSQIRFRCEEKDCHKSFTSNTSLQLHLVKVHNCGRMSKPTV